MHKQNDIGFRISMILLTFVISVTNGLDLNSFYMTSSYPLYGLLFVILFWELNRVVFLKAYKKLLPDTPMGRRILVIFCCCYAITMPLRWLYFYSKGWFFPEPAPPVHTFIWNNLFNSLLAVWPFIASYEMFFVNREIRRIENEKEVLVQANLQRRFDSLQEQVNPHFLFNNLNSLSTLVTRDPDKANEFVEQMSQVYRYLLRNNEEVLSPLHEELKFIESYINLLKTRFGDGFQPALEIDAHVQDYAIPSMTLQLLVENAVKHNIMSPESPLQLRLYTRDQSLVVTNNLQPKPKPMDSNGVGLANIVAKYQLLNQPAVEITKTNTAFTVILPLIQTAI
jgi:hypothetical protein